MNVQETITALQNHEGWGGYGYLGERRNVLASVLAGEYTQAAAIRVAQTDLAVCNLAEINGWSFDELFAWANSKDGRWFADMVFGAEDGADTALLISGARQYFRKQM